MTVKTLLISSVVSSFLSVGAFVLTLIYLDPQQAGIIGLLLFFLSVFLATASIMSLFGYFTRRIFTPKLFPAYTVRTSLRQGILVGLFTIIILFLQLIRLYRWWIAVILIVLFVFTEIVFLSYDRSNLRKSKEN